MRRFLRLLALCAVATSLLAGVPALAQQSGPQSEIETAQRRYTTGAWSVGRVARSPAWIRGWNTPPAGPTSIRA